MLITRNFEDAVREALKPRGSRVLPFSDLCRSLLGRHPDPADEMRLRATVADLERRGEIVRVRGEKLSLIEFTDYQAGTLAVRGEGRGFLLSGEPKVPDLPIAKGGLKSALDGDFVLARVEKQKSERGVRYRAPREMGVIVKVLVRRHEIVVGKIGHDADGSFLIPFDRKIDARIRIAQGRDLGAPRDMFVEARLLAYPDDRRLALAEVISEIGFEGQPGVDVEVVIRKWGISTAFPEAAQGEADAAIGDVGPGERVERTDFTRRTIVTIDGESARDFDDAIEAEELPGGGFRIGVHIADVSYYVKPGTALDAEALERGTSVYFPERAVAMLPERLSSDLCSLRPRLERRTVSAVLTLSSQGNTVKAEFFRSLIRSRDRLTYTAVGALFDGTKAERIPIEPDVAAMLRVARRAAEALRVRRFARGSLDFDLPDADVILGETGDVVEIVKATRNEAHRLIEEFMLAANEAVAKHLLFVPTPAVYRVHDRPDESRLVDLRFVLEPLGYDIPENADEVQPSTFQAILDQAVGKPEERFVSDLVLRSQRKALYSVECRGHYALAAKYYCHFTSPIRRYPDLLVHRALVDWLQTRRPPDSHEEALRTRTFEEASRQSSSRERRAEAAERELMSWKKFSFLAPRVGQEFEAYISAVVAFGFFVTLSDSFVDGLVPMDALEDDYYKYEDVEHRLVGVQTGRVFRLGDRIRVVLVQADHERRMLAFRPAGADSASPRRKIPVGMPERRTPGPRRGRAARGGGRR